MWNELPETHGLNGFNFKWGKNALNTGYELVGPRGKIYAAVLKYGKKWTVMCVRPNFNGTYKTLKLARIKAEELVQNQRELCCRKHIWQLYSENANTRRECCKKCGKSRTVNLTKKEQAAFKHNLRQMFKPKPEYDAHRVCHKFARLFGNGLTVPWKYKGFDLSRRVERWAKYYPDDVHVLSCDDNHHCCSTLVIIEHKTQKRIKTGGIEWHGLTVVYIPQCSGEDPIEFFLYPDHQIQLEKTLRNIRCKAHDREGWKD